jgi:CubicO group peptidase (beta-lactamase class C family)
MTKPIAAVAAMMLVEKHACASTIRLAALLPKLADRRVLRDMEGPLDDTEPARRPITLRDLSTFRLSGFWDDHGCGFGTPWRSDPRAALVGVLMIQRFYGDVARRVHDDFWTLAYQAIED